FGPTPFKSAGLIFERLSKLTRLEELDLSKQAKRQLQVSCGLGALASLVDLRVLVFRERAQKLDKEECIFEWGSTGQDSRKGQQPPRGEALECYYE
ncbi:hypothetical protein BG011_001728, partial [Mortierella polycephala]